LRIALDLRSAGMDLFEIKSRLEWEATYGRSPN
jgi:hypothetical protein